MENYGKLPGNTAKIEITKNSENVLKNKKILFVGSSFTFGYAAFGDTFVEYIAARNGAHTVKEAVSGTTLVEHMKDSYVTRIKKVSPTEKFDLVVCQLSTNDAYHKQELGVIKHKDYDTSTVIGAIQFIVEYTRNTLNCPIVFFTCPYYENDYYKRMVKALHEIAALMNFKIIDMYSDKKFNAISKKTYDFYMADPVHPTRAGYYYWLTPYMEQEIVNFFLRWLNIYFFAKKRPITKVLKINTLIIKRRHFNH